MVLQTGNRQFSQEAHSSFCKTQWNKNPLLNLIMVWIKPSFLLEIHWIWIFIKIVSDFYLAFQHLKILQQQHFCTYHLFCNFCLQVIPKIEKKREGLNKFNLGSNQHSRNILFGLKYLCKSIRYCML